MLLSKAWEKEGCWELGGKGEPCPCLLSCMAFALCLQALELPPQCVCLALRVLGSRLGELGCVFTG